MTNFHIWNYSYDKDNGCDIEAIVIAVNEKFSDADANEVTKNVIVWMFCICFMTDIIDFQITLEP